MHSSPPAPPHPATLLVPASVPGRWRSPRRRSWPDSAVSRRGRSADGVGPPQHPPLHCLLRAHVASKFTYDPPKFRHSTTSRYLTWVSSRALEAAPSSPRAIVADRPAAQAEPSWQPRWILGPSSGSSGRCKRLATPDSAASSIKPCYGHRTPPSAARRTRPYWRYAAILIAHRSLHNSDPPRSPSR